MSWKGYTKNRDKHTARHSGGMRKNKVSPRSESLDHVAYTNEDKYKSLSQGSFTNELQFGQHKGKCAEDLAKIDPGYIVWLIDNDILKDPRQVKLFKMWYNHCKKILDNKTETE
jgi:hypothetical protein